MDNNLKSIREQISAIDRKIIVLLENRFYLSNEIGIIKNNKGYKIKNLEQEKKVLAQIQITTQDPGITRYLVKIFTSIIKISRKSQKSVIKNSLQKDRGK